MMRSGTPPELWLVVAVAVVFLLGCFCRTCGVGGGGAEVSEDHRLQRAVFQLALLALDVGPGHRPVTRPRVQGGGAATTIPGGALRPGGARWDTGDLRAPCRASSRDGGRAQADRSERPWGSGCGMHPRVHARTEAPWRFRRRRRPPSTDWTVRAAVDDARQGPQGAAGRGSAQQPHRAPSDASRGGCEGALRPQRRRCGRLPGRSRCTVARCWWGPRRGDGATRRAT